MKGVIIAAGYGTRFLPASKTIPKEMFPLIDRPAISFIVDEFLASGIRDILIVSSRRKKALEDYFDREAELESVFLKEGKLDKLDKIRPQDANFYFVRQKAMRGTGDALLLSEQFAAGDTICVAYPDDIVFGKRPLAQQLQECRESPEQCVLAVMEVDPGEAHRYGIVELQDRDRVRRVVEKPPPGTAPSNLAVIGRYLVTAEIFPLLKEERKKHPDGEFYQVEPVNKLAGAGKVRVCPLAGQRLDIGEPLGYLKAITQYALQRDDLAEAYRSYLQSLPG